MENLSWERKVCTPHCFCVGTREDQLIIYIYLYLSLDVNWKVCIPFSKSLQTTTSRYIYTFNIILIRYMNTPAILLPAVIKRRFLSNLFFPWVCKLLHFNLHVNSNPLYLSQRTELTIPATGNVFYAMSSASTDFLLRRRGGNTPVDSPSLNNETCATFPRIKAKGRRLVRALF